MEVSIHGHKLAECLNDEDACRRRYGQRMSALIFRRLAQLLAAPSLETMRNIGRCHELKGNMEGLFALDLVHPYRLIFAPSGDKATYMEGRSILWGQVVAIEIIAIEDYH